MTDSDPPEHRLAVYGSLRPGGPNHHVVDGLPGRWVDGTVRGHLRAEGWGADLGYPGIILDRSGDDVPVTVLESSALPEHWPRIDAFEGTGYRRVVTTVTTPHGDVRASIYELDQPPPT